MYNKVAGMSLSSAATMDCGRTGSATVPSTSRPRLGSSTSEGTSDARYARALAFWASMSSRLSNALPSTPSGYLETALAAKSCLAADSVAPKADGAKSSAAGHSSSTTSPQDCRTESASGNRKETFFTELELTRTASVHELYDYLRYALEDLFNTFIGELDTNLTSTQTLLYRRETIFTLPRLERLVKYGVSHIQKCLTVSSSFSSTEATSSSPLGATVPWSSLQVKQQPLVSLSRQNISDFLQYPTRLFVLLELAFILEAIPHHRDFGKGLITAHQRVVASPSQHQFAIGPYLSVRHPFSDSSLCKSHVFK